MSALLTIRNLRKVYRIGRKSLFDARRVIVALDGISFDVGRGETFGLVGESGCGKTTTARLVLRLVEPTSGYINFDGRDLLTCGKEELRQLRREMQLVFQDPMSALNPRMSIGASIADILRFHDVGDSRSRVEEARNMLEVVGLSRTYYGGLPHEFSGGQCQRVGIARALVMKPKLVLLDEPVSSLDVSIRAQILNLLRALQNEYGLTYIFISHDLMVVRRFCSTMAVLYLGKIVEEGPSEAVSLKPLHPYTQALVNSVPQPDPRATKARDLLGIEGELPSALAIQKGCRFESRCPHRMRKCAEREPALVDVGESRKVACFLHSDTEGPDDRGVEPGDWPRPPAVEGAG